MSELLYRPSSFEDEDLVGYLRRLALGNGFAGWRELVRAIGFKPTKAVLLNAAGPILNALGVSMDDAKSSFVINQRRAGWDQYERQKYEAVCTQCLRESEHLRKHWSHCLVTACSNHKCQLIDHCPNCNEMLEYTRMSIAMCDCGYDLRFATPLDAPPIQCWASARMTGDLITIEDVEEIGGRDDYLHLANLLFQLAVRFDPQSKIKPGGAVRPKRVAEAISLLLPILAIFEDIRPRLAAHIALRFAAGNRDSFNLSGRLGAWHKALDTACRKNRAFPIIWEIFSDAVFENFDGLIRGQAGLTPSLGKKRQYLGVGEAAKFIGVSKPVLMNAIATKQMSVWTGREGISYAVHMLSRAECEVALHSRSDWISMTAACAFLHVSKTILHHLINADIVTLDRNWDQSVFKAGPICKDQLVRILDRMDGTVQHRPAKRTIRLD